MCFGGGGSRATITKPDYNAYDKQFELQKEAIANSMDSDLRLKQQELQAALGDKADVRRQLNSGRKHNRTSHAVGSGDWPATA